MKHPGYSYTMNGSDYAGLPSSSLWPYQIVMALNGQIQKERMGKVLMKKQGVSNRYASFL